MFKTALVCSLVATTSVFSVVHDFQSTLPQPVLLTKEDPRLVEVRKALRLLGRDEAFAYDVFVTATAKNIDPIMWVANVECESEFKRTAVSPKGYKGLGQTPRAQMRPGYDAADLMLAACIYAEKIRIAKGDERKALQLYKGGNNPAALKEAEKVFRLTAKLKTKIQSQEDIENG